MPDLSIQLHRYANAQLRRVLTQMDRDPNSPTFGCFDRNYWHYKIRDFPSSILQQGVFAIDAVRQGDLLADVQPETIESWCVAAVNALGRQVDRSGGVDEYYPFERSYPAAAFGLYAAGRVLTQWPLHLRDSIDWQPLKRLAEHLADRVESKAMNQQAAGLAGLALAAKLSLISPEQVKPHADRLFASQHPEGWFYEYGGPDFGYLAVTLDALTDYYDVTQDDRAIEAIDRAVTFLSRLVGADGKLPSTLNCRNTDYVVPYGLVRAAARNPIASWLVETLFANADEPQHFLWATDDRYHCHYIYASVVRALPHLEKMLPPQAPSPESEIWLEGCGYWIFWNPARTWTAYVAAKKGGLVRIHRQEGAIVDFGWRIRSGKNLWTSNWWSDEWKLDRSADTIRISGACQASKFHISTPLKHGLLRILAKLLGDRLIPLLKQQMIFRTGQAQGVPFDRTVQISADGVEVIDRFAASPNSTATPSPRQNLRHVASADSFSLEELQPALIAPASYQLNQAIEVRSSWRNS
ncbi:hypothetical protein H6F67_10705 [Microcoleus sp. FACHB-1515]|uniref:hypothetical protein n=1 Tax=Cyanophyceae TaxID=3028117 RepID=UPI0016895D64|nr:hypothetical protein [Microcoleus sp. FACHB-1515]MBD2090323.1 hypothetical protein [Microcoleus sp. FACHB-1515]